jgi:hypothetical protein
VISERDAHAIAKEMVTEDLVLPSQLTRGHRNDSLLSGEKALMLAVLEDGIRCFQGHLQAPRIHPRRLEREATEWITSTAHEETFSFVNICETLGLNPSALRTRLLNQKAARLEGAADAPKFYRLHLRVRRRKGT